MKKVLLIVFGIMSFAVADIHPGLKNAIDRGDVKTAENLVKKFNIKDIYCPSNISFEQAFPIYEDNFSSNPSVMWEKCDPAFVKSAERNVCKQSVSLCKYYLGKLFQEGDADLLNSVFEDILQAKLHIQKERRLVEQHEFVKASKQECIDQLENIRTQKNDSIINWYNADCRYLFDAASCSKIFGKFGVASIDSVNTSYSIKVKECKKKPKKNYS